MPTTRRGSSSYFSSSPSTSHTIPLPAGSAVGDWVILGVSIHVTSTTLTMPGTTIFQADQNTMHYGLSKKQLVSGDIAAGSLILGISTSQHATAVCVGYSESAGFDTPGTVWDKGGVSRNFTTAPAVTSDGIQDILVFSLIKHSGTPQSYSSTAPATTSLETAIVNGSGVPASHVGVYTGASADRTNNWSVWSVNGVGFQVAVIPSAPPVLLAEYTSGALTSTGATVAGSASLEVISESGYDRILVKSGTAAKYLQWSFSDQSVYSVRFYAHLPNAWAATSTDLFRGLNASASEIYSRVNLSGTGSPSRMRWVRDTNTQFSSTAAILEFSTTYRIELQSDTTNDLIRGALWSLGSDAPLHDSGWVSGNVGSAVALFRFGATGGAPASLPDFSISRIAISNNIGSWIGRHETDALPSANNVEVLGVWNGTVVEAAEILGQWNGATVEPVESIDVT